MDVSWSDIGTFKCPEPTFYGLLLAMLSGVCVACGLDRSRPLVKSPDVYICMHTNKPHAHPKNIVVLFGGHAKRFRDRRKTHRYELMNRRDVLIQTRYPVRVPHESHPLVSITGDPILRVPSYHIEPLPLHTNSRSTDLLRRPCPPDVPVCRVDYCFMYGLAKNKKGILSLSYHQ